MGAEEAGKLISRVSGWTLEEEKKESSANSGSGISRRRCGSPSESESSRKPRGTTRTCPSDGVLHGAVPDPLDPGLHENDFIMAAKVNRLL